MLTSFDTNEYDKNSRIVRYAHLNAETLEPTYEIITSYSEKNREIAGICYLNGTPSHLNKKIEQLDEYDNPLSKIMIRDNDTLPVWNFKYTYDSQNNWIEKTGYKGRYNWLKVETGHCILLENCSLHKMKITAL